MAILPLVIAPHPIFRQRALPVEGVNDNVRSFMDDMLETMYHEQAIGLGSNMVGVLKRVIVADLQEEGIKKPYLMANPEILEVSEEIQEIEERSLCFPGIMAPISRPKIIRVGFLDYQGNTQELKAEGLLSTVLQHEIDYLNGVTFLDHLSSMKRSLLLKKMQQFKKSIKNHVHGEHCRH